MRCGDTIGRKNGLADLITRRGHRPSSGDRAIGFDLASWAGVRLCVAEVKSSPAESEEDQPRLGLVSGRCCAIDMRSAAAVFTWWQCWLSSAHLLMRPGPEYARPSPSYLARARTPSRSDLTAYSRRGTTYGTSSASSSSVYRSTGPSATRVTSPHVQQVNVTLPAVPSSRSPKTIAHGLCAWHTTRSCPHRLHRRSPKGSGWVRPAVLLAELSRAENWALSMHLSGQLVIRDSCEEFTFSDIRGTGVRPWRVSAICE